MDSDCDSDVVVQQSELESDGVFQQSSETESVINPNNNCADVIEEAHTSDVVEVGQQLLDFDDEYNLLDCQVSPGITYLMLYSLKF